MFKGKGDVNNGAGIALAADIDFPMMLLDDLIHNRHSQAGSILKTAEKGLEKLLFFLGAHSDSIISKT